MCIEREKKPDWPTVAGNSLRISSLLSGCKSPTMGLSDESRAGRIRQVVNELVCAKEVRGIGWCMQHQREGEGEREEVL